MPVETLVPPPEQEQLRRKKFSRAEVETMLDAGLFQGQRYELIDGELIDKMGQKPVHANAIRLLAAALIRAFGPNRVQIQLPIEVSGPDRTLNEPEPDMAVLREGIPPFRDRHPLGTELTLLVEASDTTVRHDLTTKRDLYARAEVAEYWVLDLSSRHLWVHRNPVAGGYESVERLTEEQETTLDRQPVKVCDLLPLA